MFFTSIFSFLIALAVLFGWKSQPAPGHINALILVITLVGSAYLLMIALAHTHLFSPLQKAETKLTPKIVDLHEEDRPLFWSLFCSMLFPLASFVIAFQLTLPDIHIRYLFALWIFLLGISMDLFYFRMKRSLSYLNPFQAMDRIQNQAIANADKGDEAKVCDSIDSLTETAIKASDHYSITLANKALSVLPQVIGHYLKAATQRENRLASTTDSASSHARVEYVLFYLFERLQMLYNNALEKKQEILCQSINALLGKIAITTATYDLSFTNYPLFFMEKFAKMAQEKDMKEVVIKSAYTLREVGKTIVEETNINREGLRDVLSSIIGQLDDLAKETFRRDKSTKIPLLVQPFVELKGMLKSGKMETHPDSAGLIKQIDSILEEFSALTHIVSRLPSAPPPPSTEAKSA